MIQNGIYNAVYILILSRIIRQCAKGLTYHHVIKIFLQFSLKIVKPVRENRHKQSLKKKTQNKTDKP